MLFSSSQKAKQKGNFLLDSNLNLTNDSFTVWQKFNSHKITIKIVETFFTRKFSQTCIKQQKTIVAHKKSWKFFDKIAKEKVSRPWTFDEMWVEWSEC